MKKIVAILIITLFLASCHSNKSVFQSSKRSSKVIKPSPKVKITNDLILSYIDKYSPIAQSNMKNYGIPASIILAQALLESGYGTATLCIQANNHFGIKCHKDWMGESVSYDDDSRGECFRKYRDPFDSFRDHAIFLTSGSRYSSLFQFDTKDYKAWAYGLKNAGYATDSQYPAKLITLIEKYQLYSYDNVEYEKRYVDKKSTRSYASNKEDYQVLQGDTLYSISKRFNMTVDDLKQKNNFSDNSISVGQMIRIK